MSKEIPILFSTPMVQAILGGRKTMTRRIIKPQPKSKFSLCRDSSIEEDEGHIIKCPYGKPGDLLWVRETWTPGHSYLLNDPSKKYWCFKDGGQIYSDGTFCPGLKKYNAGAFDGIKWKPSIHMPKVAARIWLEVTSVRVERLQEISEADAIAEGIEPVESFNSGAGVYPGQMYKNYFTYGYTELSPIDSVKSLWYKINGEESWQQNPWVWVIEFKVLSTTGKQIS